MCKLTSKNQVTLPKELVRQCGVQTYFEARLDGNRIVLEPVVVQPMESSQIKGIRDRVARLGLDEDDVEQLVAEARRAYGS